LLIKQVSYCIFVEAFGHLISWCIILVVNYINAVMSESMPSVV